MALRHAGANPARGNAMAYAILSLISAYCAVPFFWAFLASVDGTASLFLKWPEDWTAANYTKVFLVEDGATWFFNSVVVVGCVTLLVMVLGGLGSYALSRTQAWWKRPFLYLILLIRVVPPPALIVPLYKVLLLANGAMQSLMRAVLPADWYRPAMRIFGFVDGYLGIILILTAMQLPLALWILKTFFDTVSKDYDEAALLDGASLTQRIRLVMLPLALPGLAAAGLFAFISAWGDFLMPLIFISSPELQMLPLGLFRAFLRVNTVDYGFLTALAVLYMIPSVVAFGLARRFLVQTFGGGVKG